MNNKTILSTILAISTFFLGRFMAEKGVVPKSVLNLKFQFFNWLPAILPNLLILAMVLVIVIIAICIVFKAISWARENS